MPAPPPHHAGTAGHRLHLLLGMFPVVCFTGALASDIAYADTADMQWANFSVWLLAGGLVMGALAILAGIVGYAREQQRGSAAAALVHGGGTILVMLLALWNVLVHSRDAWTSVVPTGLTLSIVTVLLMAVIGWLGGLLDRRYRLEART